MLEVTVTQAWSQLPQRARYPGAWWQPVPPVQSVCCCGSVLCAVVFRISHTQTPRSEPPSPPHLDPVPTELLDSAHIHRRCLANLCWGSNLHAHPMQAGIPCNRPSKTHSNKPCHDSVETCMPHQPCQYASSGVQLRLQRVGYNWWVEQHARPRKST